MGTSKDKEISVIPSHDFNIEKEQKMRPLNIKEIKNNNSEYMSEVMS